MIELERNIRALDSSASPAQLSKNPRKLTSADNGILERLEQLRNKDISMSSYNKSQLNLRQSRATNDRSQPGESRSLLARMKEEFKQSTNNSLAGQSFLERERPRANDPILVKNVLLKPRIISMNESPLEMNKHTLTSFVNIKNEFYGKISKQKLDSSSAGTLDNLFNILHKESRRTGDMQSNASQLSRSKHLEPGRLAMDSDHKSEGMRGSSRVDYSKNENEARLFGVARSDRFPAEQITQLRQRLALLDPAHFSQSEHDLLQLLAIDLSKLIRT